MRYTFLTISLLLLLPTQAWAFSPSDADFSAKSGVVIDDQGKFIFQKGDDTRIEPASVTKLLSTYVALKSGFNPKKQVVIDAKDNQGGSSLPIRSGTKLTCKDILYSALIMSANNSATSIYKCTGLSKTKFLKKMNDTAIELGATNSKFLDLSGLSDHNYTTARDLGLISAAAFKEKQISDILKIPKHVVRTIAKKPLSYTIKNTNAIIQDHLVGGMIGKTGYLTQVGHNFAAKYTSPDKKDYTIVLLGNPSRAEMFDNLRITAMWADTQSQNEHISQK